jgi:hypothetical protein
MKDSTSIALKNNRKKRQDDIHSAQIELFRY